LRYAGIVFAVALLGADAANCIPHVYAPAGSYRQTVVPLHGPGLVLQGGGTDIDPLVTWMHDTLSGGARGRFGNVVVIRAYGDDDYDTYMQALGPFQSVRTIVIPPCAEARDVDAQATYVAGADAVFFSGGDQANYARWKDSALIAAVRKVWARGGVVGGTSAGLAIQGEYAYDSVAADRLHPNDDDYEVRTRNAVPNPLEPEISFTSGMFAWPPLERVITDTHFARRDRFGRLVAFLARLETERRLGTGALYGLGIDERSALAVDRNGIARLMKYTGSGYQTRGAYLVRLIKMNPLVAGQPLRATVRVLHLSRAGARLDLAAKQGEGTWYDVDVDGKVDPPYSKNPYEGDEPPS